MASGCMLVDILECLLCYAKEGRCQIGWQGAFCTVDVKLGYYAGPLGES